MLLRHMQETLPTIYEEKFNLVELQTHREILEEKLLKLLKPEPETHIYLTFEQVLESEDGREVLPGTILYQSTFRHYRKTPPNSIPIPLQPRTRVASTL